MKLRVFALLVAALVSALGLGANSPDEVVSKPLLLVCSRPSAVSGWASNLACFPQLSPEPAAAWRSPCLRQVAKPAGFATGSDVYVAGYEVIKPQERRSATLWVNGVAQRLSNGDQDASANSVFVSGEDVYVAGHEDSAKKNAIATLWVNGAAQRLGDGNQGSVAFSVFVSGNDVYVAGRQKNDKKKKAAVLWKNGEAQVLTDGSRDAEADAVFVSGDDVYVVGCELSAKKKDKQVAMLWKNGEARPLTNEDFNAYAVSVFVSGGDVYVAGSQIAKKKPTAVLWKNGEAQLLGDGKRFSTANSVFVSGGDVYVAGAEESQAGKKLVATVWKNGVPNPMNSNIASNATSVFVTGGYVYVAREDTGFGENQERHFHGIGGSSDTGWYSYDTTYTYALPTTRAAVQKNHIFQRLGDPDNKSGALSVFVK